jgi:hypothetical protein
MVGTKAGAVPSFWIPSQTPQAKKSKVEKPVRCNNQDLTFIATYLIELLLFDDVPISSLSLCYFKIIYVCFCFRTKLSIVQ